MKVLRKLAGWIYLVLSKRGSPVPVAVKSDLQRLHPGENLEEVCREYFVTKMVKSMMIAFVGTCFAVLLAIRASGERQIEGNEIERPDLASEAQPITLMTKLNGEDVQFEMEIQPVRMNQEETLQCYEEFCGKLPELIEGKNKSLSEVTVNLELLEYYEGYPFTVEWRSSVPDSIDATGVVQRKDEAQEVELRATIGYGEQEWEEVLKVEVPGRVLTAEQERQKAFEAQLIISQEDTVEEEYWSLPKQWEGEDLQWQYVVEDNSLLLWVGVMLVSVVIFVLGDKDLHGDIEKRKELMKKAYPDIVHKLVLYLGAGMTLQGAFCKIAMEYEARKSMGKAKEPAYEEMLYTCRELKSGVSEGVAYERFGKRTGLQEYIRLGTLLAQNLKKGSSSLLPRLQEEAEQALAERIQVGKKLGEEASTKLLVPMVMMLGVVMIMVMLPAFSAMGL